MASSSLVPGGVVRFPSGDFAGRSPPSGSVEAVPTVLSDVPAGLLEVSSTGIIVAFARSWRIEACSSWCGSHSESRCVLSSSAGRLREDPVKRFMKGDCYIGRGCRQRSLGCSLFANTLKVAKHGRDRAIELFAKHLDDDASLRSSIWTLSGLRLLCHCGPLQSCHGDVLIAAFVHDFPGAYDRHDTAASVPPLQRN